MLIISITRNQVFGLLLILLWISSLHHHGVSGARCLNEKVDNVVERPQFLDSNSTEDSRFFATIDRQVPSSPDPLHNSMMIMLEGANATTETVEALRSGTSVLKAMNKATNIDDLEKTMDEINDQSESMKQIQESLSAPIGAAADFDEDELEAELEELEGAELEEQLFQPTTAAPTAPVHVNAPVGRQPTRPAPQRNNHEEDELAALQAEMAL
ncbi:hypothetical protein OROHE_027375 [Orobanche hederae]